MSEAQTEQRLSPEHSLNYTPLIGLQARILLQGDALDPNKVNLPIVSKDALGSLEQRNYSIFNNASSGERKTYWQGKENNDFDKQKAIWINNLTSTFTNGKDYFANTEEGKKWTELFSKLGINTSNFTSSDAETLYNRYFTGDKKDSDIKKFVSDVVSVHKTPDGKIDYEKLKQDLPAVQWLANIFGVTSSEVIPQLIDAESKLQTKPDELVTQINEDGRINKLLPREKELLEFLKAEKKTTEVSPTDTEAIKKGAKYFIDQLNNPDETTELGKYIKERFTDHDPLFWNRYLLTMASERYKLPMAYLQRSSTKGAVGHATLLLKAPYKNTAGKWAVEAYDPYIGKREMILDNFDEKKNFFASKNPITSVAGRIMELTINGEPWRIEANAALIESLAGASIYDLTEGIPEDVYIPLQPSTDKKHCSPNSFYMGYLLTTLKPDKTAQEQEGLKRFEEDFGIKLHEKTVGKVDSELSINSDAEKVLEYLKTEVAEHVIKYGSYSQVLGGETELNMKNGYYFDTRKFANMPQYIYKRKVQKRSFARDWNTGADLDTLSETKPTEHWKFYLSLDLSTEQAKTSSQSFFQRLLEECNKETVSLQTKAEDHNYDNCIYTWDREKMGRILANLYKEFPGMWQSVPHFLQGELPGVDPTHIGFVQEPIGGHKGHSHSGRMYLLGKYIDNQLAQGRELDLTVYKEACKIVGVNSNTPWIIAPNED